jgi:hypothetical protein
MGKPDWLCGNPENAHHFIKRLLKVRNIDFAGA